MTETRSMPTVGLVWISRFPSAWANSRLQVERSRLHIVQVRPESAIMPTMSAEVTLVTSIAPSFGMMTWSRSALRASWVLSASAATIFSR